jgi:ribosomal protein S1
MSDHQIPEQPAPSSQEAGTDNRTLMPAAGAAASEASQAPAAPAPTLSQQTPTPVTTGATPEPAPAAPPGPRARLRDLDKDIERELAEALGDFATEQMLAERPHRPASRPAALASKGAERLRGRVLRTRGQDVFVDLPGYREQGILSIEQFLEGPPAPGLEVEVQIEGYDQANGLLLLSRRGVAVEADWSSLTPGMIVEARVTEVNKGGLAVLVNGLRGFMPFSQIDLYRVSRPEEYVNQRLLCLVLEADPERRQLVVSRRALLEKEREEQRARLWQELAEGQVREGVIRAVQPFGAFVDLGGLDGLIPVSEMSWQRVKDPAEIVQPGQRVRVVVLKIDREKRKISLGMKQLLANPWDEVAEKYRPGSTVRGTVTRLAEFGAFVELEPGVEGLIHISELAPQRVRRVAEVVQPGQEVQVLVLQVEPALRRISLSLKAALPASQTAPAPEEESPAPPPKPSRRPPLPLRGGIGNEFR